MKLTVAAVLVISIGSQRGSGQSPILLGKSSNHPEDYVLASLGELFQLDVAGIPRISANSPGPDPLTVQATAIPLPTELAELSVIVRLNSWAPSTEPIALPLLGVQQYRICPNTTDPACVLTRITAQMIFDIPAFVAPPELNPPTIHVVYKNSPGQPRPVVFTTIPSFADAQTLIPASAVAGADGRAIQYSYSTVKTRSGGDRFASPGEVVSLDMFGWGTTLPAVHSGEPAPQLTPAMTRIATTAVATWVEPNGARRPSTTAEVLFSGLVPGLAGGLYQVNIRLPREVPPQAIQPTGEDGVSTAKLRLLLSVPGSVLQTPVPEIELIVAAN